MLPHNLGPHSGIRILAHSAPDTAQEHFQFWLFGNFYPIAGIDRESSGRPEQAHVLLVKGTTNPFGAPIRMFLDNADYACTRPVVTTAFVTTSLSPLGSEHGASGIANRNRSQKLIGYAIRK
jgi:hypothetical protein